MKINKLKISRINWKQVGIILCYLVGGSSLFVTMGFVGKAREAIKCNAINIYINDKNGYEFITKSDVLELLNSRDKQPVGKLINDINISLLEKLINSNSFVANAEVYSTIDGELNIYIVQRDPIVRIININDEHFYIDERGEFMPISSNYTAHVIIANGNIPNSYVERKIREIDAEVIDTNNVKPIIHQIFDLAKFIINDPFWNGQVEQININEQSEIELIPRIGNHRILLGNGANLEDKFNKLMIFYKEGLSKTGWNDYSFINLKFQNQVVCSKPSTINNKENK
jgi:cell division protein FtsQ